MKTAATSEPGMAFCEIWKPIRDHTRPIASNAPGQALTCNPTLPSCPLDQGAPGSSTEMGTRSSKVPESDLGLRTNCPPLSELSTDLHWPVDVKTARRAGQEFNTRRGQ